MSKTSSALKKLKDTLAKYEKTEEKVKRLWGRMPTDPKIRKDIVDATVELARLSPDIEKIRSSLQGQAL